MGRLTRRSVLRGAAGLLGIVGLGGCVTGGRLRRYRVTNDAIPDALPATVTVEAFATPTRDRPLLLRVGFESTADEPTEFAIEPPGGFPFGRTTAENGAPSTRGPTTRTDPQHIVLADADAGSFLDGCWTATGSGDSMDDDAGDEHVRLSPGGSVEVERAVLNHEANQVCYPIGIYRFPVTFRFRRVAASGDDWSSVPWGFSLEISDLRPDG